MSNPGVTQAQLVTQSSPYPGKSCIQLALFDVTGTAVTVVQTSAAMTLTGYAIAGSASAVAAGDTLNAALGKLEKRIALLEAA